MYIVKFFVFNECCICSLYLKSKLIDILFDTLTRIRNANLVKLSKVFVLQTDLTISICKILKEEGFIDGFETNFLVNNTNQICITLKFKNSKQKPYITSIKRISRPGIRVYTKVSSIPKVLGGIGVVVCSIVIYIYFNFLNLYCN